jgi:hypothetical protein
MRSYVVLTENGPILVMTARSVITDDSLLDSLHRRGVDKFIAYEVPTDGLHESYGLPFELIAADLQKGKDLRVLDFDGRNIFDCLRLSELGQGIRYEH